MRRAIGDGQAQAAGQYHPGVEIGLLTGCGTAGMMLRFNACVA
jgi:hypothetical protein